MLTSLRRTLRLAAARIRAHFIADEVIRRHHVNGVRVLDDLEELAPEALDELVALYKRVYGELDVEAGSVWGEGAYCSREGKLQKICLAEYEARKREDRLGCACGGTFVPFYEDAFVKGRVRSAFRSPCGARISGRLALLAQEDGLVGFSWGSIVGGDAIACKINESLPRKLDPAGERRLSQVFSPTRAYFYFDEIAIDTRHRRGLEPVLGLFMSTLKRPFDVGITDIVCWTERGSRVHRFAVLMGFEEVHDMGCGVVLTSSRLPYLMKLIYQYLRHLSAGAHGARRAGIGPSAPGGAPGLPVADRPDAYSA